MSDYRGTANVYRADVGMQYAVRVYDADEPERILGTYYCATEEERRLLVEVIETNEAWTFSKFQFALIHR